MPKFLERKLASEAAAKGKTGRAADRYIYGAMNNMGAMHGNKETAKGKRMSAKHEKKEHTTRVRPVHPGGYGARLKAGMR